MLWDITITGIMIYQTNECTIREINQNCHTLNCVITPQKRVPLNDPCILQKKQELCFNKEHQNWWPNEPKKPAHFPSYWLVNRDPSRVYEIIPIWLGRISSLTYLKQPGAPVFHCSNGLEISSYQKLAASIGSVLSKKVIGSVESVLPYKAGSGSSYRINGIITNPYKMAENKFRN